MSEPDSRPPSLSPFVVSCLGAFVVFLATVNADAALANFRSWLAIFGLPALGGWAIFIAAGVVCAVLAVILTLALIIMRRVALRSAGAEFSRRLQEEIVRPVRSPHP